VSPADTPPPKRWLEYMPITELVPATRNPKDHDLDQIQASMARFGYTEPVIIDERTGKLVSGHGRCESLRLLHDAGGPPPDGIEVIADDWLVPVNRGWASKDDVEAGAYLLAANRLVELGGWNEATLLESLQELVEGDAILGTGFDMEDVEAIQRKLKRQAAGSGDPLEGDADVEELGAFAWGVIIECDGEEQQVEMLNTFRENGYKVRALMAASQLVESPSPRPSRRRRARDAA
jgi:hypothetical protein